MAEIDRVRAKEKLDKLDNYIHELKYIISEHMLEIQNEMVELKMMISPESFTEVKITMAELMDGLDKHYKPLQDVPSRILKMTREGSKNGHPE